MCSNPVDLIANIKKKFNVGSHEVVVQTYDSARLKWFDVEEEEIDDVNPNNDIMLIVKARNDMFTSSFEDTETTPVNFTSLL